MFGLFKTRSEQVEELIENIKDRGTTTVELPSPKKEEPKPPAYEIGKTEDGKTTFTMRHAYGSTTLTMTNTGVDTLIRMLEAAKEPAEHEGNLVDEES